MAALGAAYWLAATVGLQWATVGGAGSPVWPAAGIGFAGLLLGGVRLWPAIALGRLAAAATLGSDQPWWAEAAIAGGNALATVVPVILLNRWLPIDLRLLAMVDVLRLALAAAVSATLAAGVGAAVVSLSSGASLGQAPAVATTALAASWWLGCLVSLLVVTPLVLVWTREGARSMGMVAWLHLGLLLAAVAAASYAIFLDSRTSGLQTWHVFPVLVWAALAFHVRGAAAALLIVSGLSLWGATAGTGPFVRLAVEPAQSLLLAQEFAAMAALTLLVLAAAADERRGKAALRRSRARLRDVLESTSDSVYTLDDRWRFAYLNSRAKAQLAQGRNLLGRDVWEAFPDLEKSPFGQAFREARRTGQPTRTEAFYAPLDTWFEADAHPSGDRLTVFFRDVTERRRAVRQHEESEARLAAVLEQMPVGVATAELPSGRLLFHNTRATVLLRHPLRPSEDYTGYTQYGALHVDGTPYRPEEYPIARAVLFGETVERQPMQYRRGDGTVTDLEVSAAPILDREGRPLLAVSTFEDVSDRNRAEADLKESERRLRLAQSVGGILTWDWDVESDALTWSGSLERLLGLASGGALRTWRDFLRMVHPDDLHSVRDRIDRSLDEDRPFAEEFRIIRPDGAVRWLGARGEAVRRDERGCPTRMIGVTYDVTERREAATSLAALNAELERRVEEGAARLMHVQKTESLGRLTGGIAHDFNNLLMAVLVSLELLRKRLPEGDARARQLLDNALGGARRGASLTQRMLAFARRQDLRPAAVAVPELIDGMLDLLRRSLGPEIAIETRYAPNLPPALVDAGQLEMALLNLAINARDAMPEGGRLTIEVERVPPDDFLCLRMTDTGSGMDAATLAKAGEPFFTTKGVGKGTGLGLAMVQGLAEQSGGRLVLKSEPGRGTTAEILLPPAAGIEPPPAPIAGAEPGPAPSTAAGTPSEPAAHPAPRPLRVLTVDDDTLILMGTAAMLEDLGHQPLEAGSADGALALLRGGAEVDVMLTDHAMPGMTGLRLAAIVRAEFPDLPVVLATGYAELPPDADDLVAARLAKPFTQAALAAVLARVARA